MASKGQKFKSYPLEFKENILKEYFDGNGAESLGHKYSIAPSTIRNWINKLKKGDNLSIDGRGSKATGRPKYKNLTLEDYKERYEILKNTRPSYKHDEGKSNVYNNSYKRIQTIQSMCSFSGIS